MSKKKSMYVWDYIEKNWPNVSPLELHKFLEGLYGDGTKISENSKKRHATRMDIYARDHFCCLRCGENRRSKLSLDHIVPTSEGGINEKSNMQTLCKKCNLWKANKTIDYRTYPNAL